MVCAYKHFVDLKKINIFSLETLRIKPPIGLMSKMCTEPTELTDQNNKKVRIEKGITVAIPVYSIHNDAKYYSSPEEFNPDRFAENGVLKSFQDNGVYLGFSDGPRICLVIVYKHFMYLPRTTKTITLTDS